jgi:predicted Zn-dependent protease
MSQVPDRTEFFAERVREQPENVLFRFSYGQALVNASRAAEAVDHLKIAAASRADWMVPRILLGKAYQGSGDIPAARAAFDDALALARSQGHEEPEEELLVLIAALG